MKARCRVCSVLTLTVFVVLNRFLLFMQGNNRALQSKFDALPVRFALRDYGATHSHKLTVVL